MIETLKWIGIFLLFLFIIWSICINNKYNKEYKKYLKNKKNLKFRKPYSKEEFISFFVMKGYEKELIESLYEEIRTYFQLKKNVMHPNDNFYSDYALDSFGLEEHDFYDSIFKNLNVEILSQKDLNEINNTFEFKPNFESFLKVLNYQIHKKS